MMRRPPRSTLFPYTTLFRSRVTPGPDWSPARVAWLLAFHRDRRPGLDGELGEATWAVVVEDRKSTRLNSSHANISYAVFCLKKKKITSAATHMHLMIEIPTC